MCLQSGKFAERIGNGVDDLVIEQVIRTGTADIGEKYLTVIRKLPVIIQEKFFIS